MTPIELINSFVAEKLECDIQRLTVFPLGSLRVHTKCLTHCEVLKRTICQAE